MLYKSCKIHQDPVICWEVIGHCVKSRVAVNSRHLKFLTLYSCHWAAYPCYMISYWGNIHVLLWDQLWVLIVLVARSYKYFKICCNSVILLKYFNEECRRFPVKIGQCFILLFQLISTQINLQYEATDY